MEVSFHMRTVATKTKWRRYFIIIFCEKKGRNKVMSNLFSSSYLSLPQPYFILANNIFSVPESTLGTTPRDPRPIGARVDNVMLC